MNIHKSQLFWGSLGTRVLTHPHIENPHGFSSLYINHRRCPPSTETTETQVPADVPRHPGSQQRTGRDHSGQVGDMERWSWIKSARNHDKPWILYDLI